MYHRRGALAKDEFVLVFVLPIKHVVILEYASRLAASVLLLNVLTYGKHAYTWNSCTTTFWDFRRVIVDCFTTLLSNVSGSFLISRGSEKGSQLYKQGPNNEDFITAIHGT